MDKYFQCPLGCGKPFRTASGVERHLSQGRCVPWEGGILPSAETARRGPRGKRRRVRAPRQGATVSWENVSDGLDDVVMEDNLTPNADENATANIPPGSPPPTRDGTAAVRLQEKLFTYHKNYYPNVGTVLKQKQSKTFIDRFNMDAFAKARRKNIYYPFRDRKEWKFAAYLIKSKLSIEDINEMLRLRLLRGLKLTFKTAKTLRNRMEQLPRGPRWRSIPIQTRSPANRTVYVYYRNPLQCIEAILQNPFVTDHISYTPVRVYRSAQKAVRVYSEWLSGSAAWEMQKQLPKDATLLGIILSSDKTTITSQTGNRSAHPLLISLANLDIEFRAKSSNHAYLLLALLPIPNFIDKNVKHVLDSRLTHQALDFIMEPAKQAAKLGYMMEDAFGRCRYTFPGLAGYISDLPEAQMIVGVMQSNSPMSQARHDQLGDPKLQASRTRLFTLEQLSEIKADPWDLNNYITQARGFHLNGVHKPFWRNWGSPPLADPANFINPEPLHYWHKAFHTHDLGWCINALNAAQIDFRYSVLHIHTNFRHFPDGISRLQQSTMREHCDIQRYIVTVIAGGVAPDFVTAIRALCDVRYRAQSPVLDEEDLQAIDSSLQEFHAHRQIILDVNARTVDGWNIPKLETLLNITRLARSGGVPCQYSAERTENEHKTAIKAPSRKSNNQNHNDQLCRSMDRQEKIRMFNIATEIRAAAVELSGISDNSNSSAVDKLSIITSTKALLDVISPAALGYGTNRSERDYFQEATNLLLPPRPPRLPPLRPLRTIVVHNTAIHLKKEHCALITLDEAVDTYGIHDLHAALDHYMERTRHDPHGPYAIGGHRLSSSQPLPFKRIKVWTRCQLQNKTFHPPHSVMPATTINSSPPDVQWKGGRFDPVIVNLSRNHQWPYSGLKGHCVVQVCLIMLPTPNNDEEPLPPIFKNYLTYCRRFDIIPQPDPGSRNTRRGAFPEPTTSLFHLRRARRSDTKPTGDIIPIRQLRSPANLVPKFGKRADARLTAQTSLAFTEDFYLNKYFTKQMFYSLTIPPEHRLVD